jgi:chemotaxis protein methyltransferase CheR
VGAVLLPVEEAARRRAAGAGSDVTRSPRFKREEVRLRSEEFRILRDLFEERVGISFGAESRFALERRLRERLAALEMSSFADYCEHLRYSPGADAEWEEAVDLCTTNETYFFREDYQLRSFQTEVLPLLAESAKSRRRLSIWSAGCSTGEEAYTIAILVHESRLFRDWDVRVYGSDVSKRCVASARAGVYRASSFRAISPEIRKEYFVEEADGVHVVEQIRSLCHFGQMNLLDVERVRLVGRADAVFCRNVLIYFAAPARKRVIDSFLERLYPGGVLLLGHSESLLNVTTAFELLHLKEDLVYKKPNAIARDVQSGRGVV